MTDPRFAKSLVFINSVVPLAMLGWDLSQNRDRIVNPEEYALQTTGMLALVFLMLTLAVTPIRKITGWNWLSNFRRMLGLFAFAYASIHFLIYFGDIQGFNLQITIADVLKRRFIFAGMTGLLLMLPLALTSTNGMIKRLGGKNWKRLHRLVYLAGAAGVVHYWWKVKADVTKPMAFTIVLAVLLAYRILEKQFPFLRHKPPAPRRAAAAAPASATRSG